MKRVAVVLALMLAACAHQGAQNPEDESTPQIRVVPGAASRSLWIGHGGDAGPSNELSPDAGAGAAP